MNEAAPESERPEPPPPGATSGRAWRVTKGTAEQVVYDNRHGRRALTSVVKHASRMKRPSHSCPRKQRRGK